MTEIGGNEEISEGNEAQTHNGCHPCLQYSSTFFALDFIVQESSRSSRGIIVSFGFSFNSHRRTLLVLCLVFCIGEARWKKITHAWPLHSLDEHAWPLDLLALLYHLTKQDRRGHGPILAHWRGEVNGEWTKHHQTSN